MIRTFNIHIINKKDKKYFMNYIYKYKHFYNLYCIILNEYQDNLNILLDYSIMRAFLMNTKGGENESTLEKLEYLRNKYKDNQKFNELIELSKDLKIHNISELIKDLKSKYKAFFTNKKKNNKVNKPSAKKLKNVIKYSIILDQISVSFKKKNLIGINLSDKMYRINFKHEILKKITGDIKNIKNVRIKFSNNEIYLSIIYDKNIIESDKNTINKKSAIDIGIENIISLFIDDKNNNSLLFDGKMFKKYNSNFNRLIGKLNKSIENEATEYKISKTGTKYSTKWTERGLYLKKYKKFLFEKRNRFFYNEFHKLSKRIVEYLKLYSVDLLILSKNLSELKNKKSVKNKITNQKFIQIPIIKLLNYIEMKCNENGINVEYINESYTSKCSCLTDNVNKPLDNELNGVRSNRGLFLDKKLNKIWNCDINGAVNHIKKYDKNVKFNWLIDCFDKLSNPVKIKCDYDFIKFMNNVSDKVNQLDLQRCLLNV